MITKKINSILLVDDDTANLMELNSILQSEYKLYAVNDGASALEKAKESQPDLILLDVIMPKMNGFEVLAELKKTNHTKSIPVIFITALSEEGNESEGLAMGAVDYIRKPFNAEVVKLRVSQQIKIINLQRELKDAADIAAKAAAAAEEAASAAEAASKSKSSFLANMSHEIRTPMNAIMGVTDILLQIERLPNEIGDGLEMIYASSEMLLGIINDILDFSKIEAGKLDIVPAHYKTANMITDAVHFNTMRIGNKPIKFELKIEENIPANLIGDELRIKQILNNVLSNAFKYTDSGKVIMSVSAESKSPDQEITIIFCVSDTGPGMTDEQLGRLFEEYSRFNNNIKRSIEGTGLGFSIMQRLVNLMNGGIQVESELGKGTIVTIRLPQSMADSEILGPEVAENLKHFHKSNITQRKRMNIKREPMPYGKVLIVDDIETNLFVAERLMKLYKLNIETSVNGREALDKVRSGKTYDIIFMDHMMPEMDGMEATKLIREWEADQNTKTSGTSLTSGGIPIVALTANAVSGQADIFLENGFDAFLSKPLDINQLDFILNKLIRDKQTPQTIEAARLQYSEPQTSLEGDTAGTSLLHESFIRDARKAITLLEDLEPSGKKDNSGYNSEEGLRKYITCVHGMRSSLNAINELELSELAKMLEQAGRDKNFDFITQTISGFKNNLHRLLQKFEPKQCVIIGDESEDLQKKLTLIAEKTAEYNRKGALDIIASIDKCSKETNEFLEKLKENITHSEFEEAQKAITAYIEQSTV